MKRSDLQAIDKRKTVGGWVGDLPDLPPHVALNVRGLGNPDYQKLNAQLRPPRIEGEPPLTDEEDTAAQIILLREAILIGWQGIEEPFDDENITEYLQSHTFRNAVWYAAMTVAKTGKDTAEEVLKNSLKPSAGR